MLIGTFLPESEYYEVRFNQTMMVSISLVMAFLILIYMINKMVAHKIGKGIKQIADNLYKIAEGNLELVVDEKENPEFEMLSNSINKMVNNIKAHLQNNVELLDQQKSFMDQNFYLIENVKAVCSNIDGISKETLDNSKAISRGTEEQENAITDLNDIMNQLSIELEKNSESSLDIAHKTQETVHRMIETKDKMELLEFSISEIEATNKSVGIIANMVRNNAQDIQKAVEGLEQISSVVKQNVTISQESEQTAQKLAVESERLLGLIE